jgi:hypothetical protein
MAFSVVKNGGERPIWMSTDGASTYYIGQIVTIIGASKANIAGTIKPLAVPAGVADTTNFQIPFGIVVGFNDRTETSDATGIYATGVLTQAAQLARTYFGAEGMYAKGDPQLLVQVERIFPHTLIRGNIYNAALGTAPTVVSDTGGADTTGYTTAGTTGACDFTPVANVCSIYCRSGRNAGLYRTTNDTSTTAPDVTVAFPYDVALGDTFVRVPLKQGLSQIYIGGPGLYIDCSLTATNNFMVFVEGLNLENAGKETADFTFAADHFANARA